jgi:hypothetical protein
MLFLSSFKVTDHFGDMKISSPFLVTIVSLGYVSLASPLVKSRVATLEGVWYTYHCFRVAH